MVYRDILSRDPKRVFTHRRYANVLQRFASGESTTRLSRKPEELRSVISPVLLSVVTNGEVP